MWILIAILSGLGDAVRDACSKHAAASIPRPLVTLAYSLCALPFLLPAMIARAPTFAEVPPLFWLLLVGVSVLHVAGGLMLVKALHSSDLSLCTPMAAFTPVFLLFVGPLIAHDPPTVFGALGAVLVAAGSYTLNLGRATEGVLAPIKALLYQPGTRLMLALALLWSVTGSIDRLVVQQLDPAFWGGAQLLLIASMLLPIAARHGGFSGTLTRRNIGKLLTVGAGNVLSLGCYLFAMQSAAAHYVICLKRTSILFSVLLGRALFQEPLLRERLPGAVLMLLGVVVISLFG